MLLGPVHSWQLVPPLPPSHCEAAAFIELGHSKRLRESDLIVQFVDHFMVQLNLFDRNIESGFDKQFLSNSQFNQFIN